MPGNSLVECSRWNAVNSRLGLVLGVAGILALGISLDVNLVLGVAGITCQAAA